MNEVSNMQMTSKLRTSLLAGAASSKGAVTQQTQQTHRSGTGNKLPEGAETIVGSMGKSQDAKAVAGQQNIEMAVASINDYVQSVQRDLHFSIDEELDRTVIKVVDAGSGDLIRQIPEEVFLDLARKLIDDGELQLVNALG